MNTFKISTKEYYSEEIFTGTILGECAKNAFIYIRRHFFDNKEECYISFDLKNIENENVHPFIGWRKLLNKPVNTMVGENNFFFNYENNVRARIEDKEEPLKNNVNNGFINSFFGMIKI